MTNPTNQGGELKAKDGGEMSEVKRWFNNGNGEMADICNPSDTQPGFGTGPWVNYGDVIEMKDVHQETLAQLSAAKETIDKVRRWEYNNFPMGCRDVFPLNGKSRAALRDILKKGDCDDNNFTSKI